MKVELSQEARGQVREIDAWWRENRSAAPDLFAMPKTTRHGSGRGSNVVGSRIGLHAACVRTRQDVGREICDDVWNAWTHGLPPGPGKEAGHGLAGAGSVTCVVCPAGVSRSTARSVRPRRARPPSRAQAVPRSALERRAAPTRQGPRAAPPRVPRAVPPPCARSPRPTRVSPASLVGRGRARIWGRPQARRRRPAAHAEPRVAAEHLRVGASPYPNRIPCASGSSSPKLIVVVCRRM